LSRNPGTDPKTIQDAGLLAAIERQEVNEGGRLVGFASLEARRAWGYAPPVMTRDFFDPTPEEQQVVLIDAETLRKAEKLIESCEHCNPDGTEIPFDNIPDRVTGSDPSVTDYILESPARCPNCRREILEKTLVEPG
jgi:hypothetical protein